MCDEGQNLSDESDRWVAHGVGVPDVGLDDIFEGFLNSLQNQNEHEHLKRILKWILNKLASFYDKIVFLYAGLKKRIIVRNEWNNTVEVRQKSNR
jgi:hypothetical protein